MNINFLPKKKDKIVPVSIFLLSYIGYVILNMLFNKETSYLFHFLILGSLGGMLLGIIWYTHREDEVRRSIINQAYSIAFWATFLVLYLHSISTSFAGFVDPILPLWSVPILAWLAGYLIISIRYR